MMWEYMVITNVHTLDLVRKLNEYGGIGWELATILNPQVGEFICLLKRQVEACKKK